MFNYSKHNAYLIKALTQLDANTSEPLCRKDSCYGAIAKRGPLFFNVNNYVVKNQLLSLGKLT